VRRLIVRYALNALNHLVRGIIASLVFAATFALRIRGVSSHFYLLGDQIRDWGIALRSFTDLPLVGPATHVGGYTVGPAFYWILWAIRITLGPFFHNLPHAGGIGQAALQSAADAVLLLGIWRRTGSPWIALTTIVLVATASFDLNLAAIVWNPTMGTALAKLAIAMVLLDWHRGSPVRAAVAAGIAWSAVHAYTGAIYVVVGVFTAFLVDPLMRRDHPLLRRNAIVIAVMVLVLQVPYLLHQLTHRFNDQAMGAVTFSLGRILSGERAPEITKSLAGFVAAVDYVEFRPWVFPAAGWLLLACGAVVAARHVRDPALLSVIVLPQLLAIAGYALFLAPLDTYYYLSLMPCVALTFTLTLTAMPYPRVSRTVAIIMFAAVLTIVPARIRYETLLPRMPEYAVLVDASRKIKSLGQPMRAIRTDFPLPPTADPQFLYEVLGGRIDPTAPWICVIRADGSLRYQQVPAS